ncbi:hypothetical protein ABBQ38_012799 [Trebouxia sp. C0009 RCD-2024]
MPVFLPGGNDSNKGHLEKSTEQHKKRQIAKRQASPLNQRVAVGRRKRGGPLEDLGNALVSVFPVEMQYNIRGTCRSTRKAIRGVLQAVCGPFQKLWESV